jgi:hypothetical protein
LKRDIQLPELYYADIPMPSGVRKHPFRLPSVKARELWSNDATFFSLSPSAPPGRIETSGNWHGHPLFKEAGLKAVPVTVYGDSVQYVVSRFGKQDSLMCVFFCFPHRLPVPIAGAMPSDHPDWMQSIHVFTVIRKADLQQETWDSIWDILVWDMKSMLTGKFPSTTHDQRQFEPGYMQALRGQYIAGGARFAVIQLKQDWEHICSVYGFKSWAAAECCPFCDAPKDPTQWVACGAHARWRKTIWDKAKLAMALKGEVRLANGAVSNKMKWASHLWGLPHFDIRFIKADPMHVLFCDGVVNKTIGSLLYNMCVVRKDLPGRTNETRVEAAWAMIKKHFKPHAPPITKLTLTTFRASSADGVASVALKAKAKQTWDLWPAVYSLACDRNTNKTEVNMAAFLDEICAMMKLHSFDEVTKRTWLNAEINFLTL